MGGCGVKVGWRGVEREERIYCVFQCLVYLLCVSGELVRVGAAGVDYAPVQGVVKGTLFIWDHSASREICTAIGLIITIYRRYSVGWVDLYLLLSPVQ